MPSQRDFDRLDARFRLEPGVWDHLPEYATWGFCVFKLRPPNGIHAAGTLRRIHPMAFDFPRRDPAMLFFPTVHVHDGTVHDTASFDHTLFCQPPAEWASLLGWDRSPGAATLGPHAEPHVDRQAPVWRQRLTGTHPNRDVVLRGRVT